jgi:hypothetical protein
MPKSKVNMKIHQNDMSMVDVPWEELNVHEPNVTKQMTNKIKLPFSINQDTTTIVGGICEIIMEVLTSFDTHLHGTTMHKNMRTKMTLILKALKSSKTCWEATYFCVPSLFHLNVGKDNKKWT